ncbi:hypothetical protein PR003_g8135 [Phytophthora rubi]|uniref:Intimal thickness related receptor IRP domain-containing protein n=1 Tax=Phytophthora rubi TaxID=129364 RepID=A0A6A3N0I5_9STRA|nr:hypothetical protein PR002_g7773 [Phytophthora rubi]KAE9038991.1 hypothetical protein PR001_g7715 [Phytophthora rubi]KAE9345069.1 hypothetical protein PR003_g8135 [Phytophthora rubi]
MSSARAERGVESSVDLALFLPASLVLDFVFAAHFWSLYTASDRLAQPRVQFLVASAWLSFVTLVPFAYVSQHTLQALTDISETTMVLTLVVQVAIITRDAVKQCKLASLRYFMRAAEVFTVTGTAVAVLSVADVCLTSAEATAISGWHVTVEAVNLAQQNAALAFIVTFRYFYIALSRGSLLAAIEKHPMSTSLYALLVTHEYPFIIARNVVSSNTQFSLKPLQGFYMRVLVLLCIWANARDHAASRARRRRPRTTPQASKNRHLSSVVPQSSALPSATRHRASPSGARRLSSAMSRQSLRKVYQLHSPVVAPQPTQSAMSAFMSSLAGAAESLPQ